METTHEARGDAHRSTRILIVDDSQLIRRCMAEVLSHEPNFEVCGEASEGLEAVQKCRELLPDLVLLDLNMPGISGLETARLLRQNIPEMSIVIMSCNDASQLMPLVVQAGADASLDKAQIATDLLNVINNV